MPTNAGINGESHHVWLEVLVLKADNKAVSMLCYTVGGLKAGRDRTALWQLFAPGVEGQLLSLRSVSVHSPRALTEKCQIPLVLLLN